jgi:hypothetical protein
MKNDIRKHDFIFFLKCLKKAGTRIDQHYFQLIVAGKEEPIFRERVYCYELYHQLRILLGDVFPYKLDGELDKVGHPIIRPKKPDFIVHVPGTMERNLLVIEVKSIKVKDDLKELRDDLETLQYFLNEANYFRTIMLVYGDGKHDLPESILSTVEEFSKGYEGRIQMVWHQGPGTEPKVILSSTTNNAENE